MLSIAPPPTIYLHAGAADMRKSFDGLAGIIRGSFGGDPADGSLFLFVNKRRDRLKALWWDGDGFALWYKRLEQGTFETERNVSMTLRHRRDEMSVARELDGALDRHVVRWNDADVGRRP